jgi:hypothetical protein
MSEDVAKDDFMRSYIAAYLAGMYVARADEHLYTGKHPYTSPKEVPIEDAWFMAEVAWEAYRRHAESNPRPWKFDEDE